MPNTMSMRAAAITAVNIRSALMSYALGATGLPSQNYQSSGDHRNRNVMRLTDRSLRCCGCWASYGEPRVARRAADLMPNTRVEVVDDAWHHP